MLKDYHGKIPKGLRLVISFWYRMYSQDHNGRLVRLLRSKNDRDGIARSAVIQFEGSLLIRPVHGLVLISTEESNWFIYSYSFNLFITQLYKFFVHEVLPGIILSFFFLVFFTIVGGSVTIRTTRKIVRICNAHKNGRI